MNIYKITNLINNKIYIGKEVKEKPDYFGSGMYIKRAIKKYGKENFRKDIIQYYEFEEELDEMEKFWIRELKSQVPNGYNIAEGGLGGALFTGHQHSEESKKKISQSHKALERHCSWQHKLAISKAHKGQIISKEQREKLSIAFKGKSWIERFGEERANEIKEKIRLKRTGQKRPKQSLAMKGRFTGKNNPMYGKKMTEELKQKKREYFLTNNPGKNKSPETIRKISESKKGKPGHLHTQEYKNLMSEKMKLVWEKRKSEQK